LCFTCNKGTVFPIGNAPNSGPFHNFLTHSFKASGHSKAVGAAQRQVDALVKARNAPRYMSHQIHGTACTPVAAACANDQHADPVLPPPPCWLHHSRTISTLVLCSHHPPVSRLSTLVSRIPASVSQGGACHASVRRSSSRGRLPVASGNGVRAV
jgi:hypothetical protein